MWSNVGEDCVTVDFMEAAQQSLTQSLTKKTSLLAIRAVRSKVQTMTIGSRSSELTITSGLLSSEDGSWDVWSSSNNCFSLALNTLAKKKRSVLEWDVRMTWTPRAFALNSSCWCPCRDNIGWNPRAGEKDQSVYSQIRSTQLHGRRTCDISPVKNTSHDFPSASQIEAPDPAQTPTDLIREGPTLDSANWTTRRVMWKR